MASVAITVLLYNGPLLCGFNVGIKGLNLRARSSLCLTPLYLRVDLML